MSSWFRWETGFDKQLILNRIAKSRNIDKNNKVSFNASTYRYWLPILESAIRTSSEIIHLKHRCIVEAVSDPTVTLKDSDNFLKRCQQAYAGLILQPNKNYIVLMSITYSGEPLFKRLRNGEIIIQWQPSPKSNFMRAARKARADLEEYRKSYDVSEESEEITHILVHVSALNPLHAHELAADSLDSLRGILNLIVNYYRNLNIFSALSRPHAVNKFRPGPYRTIHNIDGSLATKTFWYENRWVHRLASVKFTDGSPNKTTDNLRKWWAKLQYNPLRDHIRQGLLRYCRALDLHDAEPALLEMWGALESLTGTQQKNYDQTVDRLVRLFQDRNDARQLAQHFRLRRNATVHAARTLNHEEADTILLQAESLVSHMLLFCLNHGNNFVNDQELFRFLDLPVDRDIIGRNIEISKFALDYQNPGK